MKAALDGSGESESALCKAPSGVIVPLVTPFSSNHALDLVSYERLLEHVIRGGVDALFPLGTTGEGPSMTAFDHETVIKFTCEHASSRCPVYVGVTSASISDSLRLAEISANCGAAAVVVAPPPYFPATVSEQIAYFSMMADRAQTPIILYNIPQMTKTAVSLEAFRELLSHPRILGIKDSSGNMVYFRRLQHIAAARKDFSLLIGADELLAEAVMLGAHGGVTGGANLAPKIFKALFLAAKSRNLGEVDRLQQRVMDLSCTLYTVGNGGSIIQGIKAALNACGICQPWVRLPLLPADEALQRLADKVMPIIA